MYLNSISFKNMSAQVLTLSLSVLQTVRLSKFSCFGDKSSEISVRIQILLDVVISITEHSGGFTDDFSLDFSFVDVILVLQTQNLV